MFTMEASKELRSFYKKRIKKNILILLLLSLAIIITCLVSLSIGASSVNLGTIGHLIANGFGAHYNVSSLNSTIVEKIRLPRILMGILAGVALSNAGLLMQGIFQNPLVSPYTLGISSGGAFGAALSIVLGLQFGFLGQYALPVAAFVFSVITMAIVYGISLLTKNAGKNLVLIGVAIGYLFSALLSLLQYFGGANSLPQIVYWMMGSLQGIGWNVVILLFVVNIICFFVMMIFSWSFNAVSYGKETALSFGVNYEMMKILALGMGTLLTAVTVSFTGIIGFVGLIAPQITRIIIGNDYRFLVPASSLVGGLLLVLSDTIARTVMSPVELPIGIITSFVGVPFFLYLIVRRRSI